MSDCFVTNRPRMSGRFFVASDIARRPKHTARHFSVGMTANLTMLLVAAICCPAIWAKEKPSAPAIRWAEGQPGCTFDRSDDGKYRYGLWNGDLGIIVAVDSQELEKARHRLEPTVSMLLTVRYRGSNTLQVRPDKISLEFVKHFHLLSWALDPDEFSTRIQNDTDAMSDETEHQVKRHPEKKAEQEALLQAHLKDMTEMMEFLSLHSLRPAKLDADNPETSGWVFFAAQSRWIGDWKKPEDFLLRVRLAGRAFEFPITLPPKEGDLILRKRPE